MNKARLGILLCGFLLLLGSSASPLPTKEGLDPGTPSGVPGNPRNIILLIGDGMALSHITAGLYHNKNIHLDEFPVVGIHKPYSFDNLIPDAAAGATAISTGVKTFNGAVGVDADSLKVTNLMEEADLKGLAVGLVTTSSITHAVPAAFYAHVPSRDLHELIALDLLTSSVDLFIGGGMQYFQKRSDGRNLLEALKSKKFDVFHHFGSWRRDIPEFNPANKVAFFTAELDAASVTDGRDYLDKATEKAMAYLSARSGEQGFILVIESSQIGQAAGENDPEKLIDEMLDFDQTVGKALDFAEENGETLVLVTSAHEKGGFALNVGSTDNELIGAFTTTEATGTLLPVFAFGPGAKNFTGIYENTDLYHRMRMALQLNARTIILD